MRLTKKVLKELAEKTIDYARINLSQSVLDDDDTEERFLIRSIEGVVPTIVEEWAGKTDGWTTVHQRIASAAEDMIRNGIY
jgi:hypothetical protein